MRLLLVEDEADLRSITCKRLTSEGYGVDACDNGEDAIDYAMATDYDVIILDIMLPKVNGLAVLKHLRTNGKRSPVILVTAKDTVEDRVVGLDCGADDYLVKPFSFQELSARVRTLMRRQPAGILSNTLGIDDLTIDLGTHMVKRGGDIIILTQREYALLEVLARNMNIVLSREKIEQHIWNFDYASGSNVIDVYIRYLRKKIDAGRSSKLIHTVRGAGYVIRKAD